MVFFETTASIPDALPAMPVIELNSDAPNSVSTTLASGKSGSGRTISDAIKPAKDALDKAIGATGKGIGSSFNNLYKDANKVFSSTLKQSKVKIPEPLRLQSKEVSKSLLSMKEMRSLMKKVKSPDLSKLKIKERLNTFRKSNAESQRKKKEVQQKLNQVKAQIYRNRIKEDEQLQTALRGKKRQLTTVEKRIRALGDDIRFMEEELKYWRSVVDGSVSDKTETVAKKLIDKEGFDEPTIRMYVPLWENYLSKRDNFRQSSGIEKVKAEKAYIHSVNKLRNGNRILGQELVYTLVAHIIENLSLTKQFVSVRQRLIAEIDSLDESNKVGGLSKEQLALNKQVLEKKLRELRLKLPAEKELYGQVLEKMK